MQYLRVILVIAAAWGWMQSTHAAALFGGPKTLPDDGTYDSSRFSNPGGSCTVSCNNSKGYIQVDIRSKCMCISGSTCFKVDIGKPGTFTTNGLGTMGKASGATYSTKAGAGDSTRFDFDAVSMGISANAAYGKWIHKSRSCQGGGQSTIGCIGVPCAKWPEVKALALQGKSVQVCGGVDYPTSRDYCPPGSSPCYALVSESQVARQRAGLYVPKSSTGTERGAGSQRGSTR